MNKDKTLDDKLREIDKKISDPAHCYLRKIIEINDFYTNERIKISDKYNMINWWVLFAYVTLLHFALVFIK